MASLGKPALYSLGGSFWLPYWSSRRHDPRFNHLYGYHYSLPLTFVLPPEISIALLLGLYVSGMTGGSFSAILLNIPGTQSAAATALDGHPMASRGEAGRALGVAIITSFVGGYLVSSASYSSHPCSRNSASI